MSVPNDMEVDKVSDEVDDEVADELGDGNTLFHSQKLRLRLILNLTHILNLMCTLNNKNIA